MRRPISTLVFACVALSALPGRADPGRQLRPSSLGWVRRAGAETCAGPAEMARAVERRLRRAVFVPAPRAELTVEASIEPAAPSGWHVLINLSGADGAFLGQRELTSVEPSCGPLAESAVLAIALMIDPEAVVGPPVPDEIPPPKDTAPPLPAQPSPGTPSAWEGALEVSGGAFGGLLPKSAAGVSGRAFAVPPSSWLALELGGTYFFGQDVPVGSGSASFSLFIAETLACSWPSRRQVALSGCAGVQVGALGATGSHLAHPQNYQRWVLNFAGRGALSFRPSEHWLVAVSAQVMVPLHRDTFSAALEPPVEVFRMAPVAGGIEIGTGYAF